MEDYQFSFIFGLFCGAVLTFLILLFVALNHNTDSNQETEIKELKQKIEIIKLNNELLKLKEVK